VAACVLNTTAEEVTLRQGEQLREIDTASAVDLEVVGPLLNGVETTVEANGSSIVGKGALEVTMPPDGDARDTECRQVIEEMLEGLPREMAETEFQRVAGLLWEFRQILSLNDFDIEYTDAVSHRIDTGDHPPIREALRRHPQTYTEQIVANIDQMLRQGVIEPCSSEWASNVVLVKKRTGPSAARSTIAG